MARPCRPFRACELAQEIIRQFGTAGPEVRAPMRDCDDVPRFIKRLQEAHRRTANSTLRFGPPTTQSR